MMAATSLPNENATAWSIRMGLGPTQVSNFRNGIPISALAADRIAGQTGIGSDFLRRGDDRFLTIDMKQRIDAALAALDAEEQEPDLSRKGQDVRS